MAALNQLIPNVVDGMSETQPNAIYAVIPKSFTTYDAGYRDVTYRQMANAVNGAAWLLQEQLGSSADPQILAYVGPNDISYMAFILGAVKAGHVVLCLSPRNTKNDHASLFAAAKCKVLLTPPPPYSPTVGNILEAVGEQCRIVHTPSIFELLDTEYPPFPYSKTFAAAKDELLAIVHTSSTTTTPKLVKYTHHFASSWYNSFCHEPPPNGYESVATGRDGQFPRAFTLFPFFHVRLVHLHFYRGSTDVSQGGGLCIALLKPILCQTILVCPLAGVAPSAAGIVEALNHVEVDIVNLPSPFAEQISKDDNLLQALTSKCKAITYGGADVSEACAHGFLSRVYVGNSNGSTEAAPYPLIRSIKDWEPSDLKHIQPHPIAGLDFRPTALPGLFEAVIVRNADANKIQPVFTLFPDLNEWRTKDLFTPHPSKSGLWLWTSRADDMIVSATGETCNPGPFEQQVCRQSSVATALIIGTGRYQKVLIVEPAAYSDTTHEAWDVTTRQEFIDGLWTVIQAANANYPEVNHVTKSRILLTEPNLPFPRAGKGTVQRAPSLRLYQRQIDALYDSTGDGKESVAAEPYKVHLTMDKD